MNPIKQKLSQIYFIKEEKVLISTITELHYIEYLKYKDLFHNILIRKIKYENNRIEILWSIRL